MRMNLPPLPEPSQEFISARDVQMQDFTGAQKVPGRKRPLLDTPFVGACTGCNMSASISVDPVDFKTLERVLDGRVVKAICPKCRKETEFRPLSPEELAENQFWLLKRQLEIREKIFQAAAAKGVTVPEHIQGAVEEYMKRLGHRMDTSRKVGEVLKPDDKIIVPE